MAGGTPGNESGAFCRGSGGGRDQVIGRAQGPLSPIFQAFVTVMLELTHRNEHAPVSVERLKNIFLPPGHTRFAEALSPRGTINRHGSTSAHRRPARVELDYPARTG